MVADGRFQLRPGFPVVDNGVLCLLHAFTEDKHQYQSTDECRCVPAELRVVRIREVRPHRTLSHSPPRRRRSRASSC